MSKEEAVFWDEFLSEAQLTIDALTAAGKQPPLDPPDSLWIKYQRALKEYNGSIYCQVRQLENIFNFTGKRPGDQDLQTFLRGMV